MPNTAKSILSANGRIEWLLMVFPDNQEEEYLAIVLELLRKTPSHIRFIVYCSSRDKRKKAATYFNTRGFFDHTEDSNSFIEKCLLVSPPVELNYRYTRWARDPFFVRWDRETQTAWLQEMKLPLDRNSSPNPNEGLAATLEGLRLTTLKIKPDKDFKELLLSGGNVLLTDHFILAGYEELKLNENEQTSSVDLVQQIKKLFNTAPDSPFRRVILVGKSEKAQNKLKAFLQAYQKYFEGFEHEISPTEIFAPGMISHLDMFLTPTGVIGDAGKPVLLMAQCSAVFTLGSTYEMEKEIMDTLNSWFCALKDELESEFTIVRNPVPLFISYKSEKKNGIWVPKPMKFYLGSFNNCLVETNHEAKQVWLPKISISREFGIHFYDIVTIERENKELWETLGFDVSFIEADFHPFLDELGGLHCMTKELARSMREE